MSFMAGQQASSCPLEQHLIDARLLFNHLLMAVHVRDNFGISSAPPVPGLIPPLVGLAHGISRPLVGLAHAKAPAPIQRGQLKGCNKGLGKGKGALKGTAVPGAEAGKGRGKAAKPVPAVVLAGPSEAARSRSRSR
jgi:hypothetical protein